MELGTVSPSKPTADSFRVPFMTSIFSKQF